MKKSARWIPALVVPAAVVAAVVVVPAVSADADVVLPEKTPQEVLALAASSTGTSFSGTVEQTSDLGLPELPASGPGADGDDATSQALGLLTGTRTARVFADGADRQRVQVVEELAERDLYRDGTSAWTWDSRTKEATHVTLPEQGAGELPATLPDGSAVPRTPAELADALLAAVEPTTTVTATDNARVAGRSAYQVVLTPDDPDTLVGGAVLTVDAETGLPLRVAVTAKGQSSPAFSVGFTDVDLTAPSDDVFAFTPPAGAEVTEVAAPTGAPREGAPAGHDHPAPTVLGSGWSTVVGVAAKGDDAPAEPGSGAEGAGDATALLDQLTVPVDGGRVLQTALLSVYLADDGQAWVGAVDADALRAAVADQR